MSESLFRSLDSAAMANDIRRAQQSVCYAAPGIQQGPASAMAEAAKRTGPELVTVCLDFDEHVIRMGFGDFIAVKTLRLRALTGREPTSLASPRRWRLKG